MDPSIGKYTRQEIEYKPVIEDDYCEHDINLIVNLESIIKDISTEAGKKYIADCLFNSKFTQLETFLRVCKYCIEVSMFKIVMSNPRHSYYCTPNKQIYEFISRNVNNIHLFSTDRETLSYLLELFLRNNDKRLVDILLLHHRNELYCILHNTLNFNDINVYWQSTLNICVVYNIKYRNSTDILLKEGLIQLNNLFRGYLENDYMELKTRIEIISNIFLKYQQKFSDMIDADKTFFFNYIEGVTQRYYQEDYNWIDSVLMFITDGRIVTEDEFKTIINLHCCGESNSEILKFLTDSYNARYGKNAQISSL